MMEVDFLMENGYFLGMDSGFDWRVIEYLLVLFVLVDTTVSYSRALSMYYLDYMTRLSSLAYFMG